ncbi:MAG TPA: type IV secretion system DNA-binding domain-containing protein [Candidatus Angelobacter sp.]|nr:type IV secretion system DNA-binding domain-containing protein [Candidatus Angelobacter sp.]
MHESPEILRFPVYEPAGRDVVLYERELLQHMLILGATGSGKTCLLHRAVEQLLNQEAGLLIFDAKGDDTVARVKTLAKSAGRADQLAVVGENGDHYLNLFRPLRSLVDVDRMTRRLLAGSGRMGVDNAYWDEFRYALFDAALTLLVVSQKRVRFGPAMTLLHEWFFAPKNKTPSGILAAVDRAARCLAEVPPAEARKISQALDTVRLWETLDDRTRGNVQSTLLNALRPLLSIPAANCFEPLGRPVFDPANIARRGAVCVASFNATLEPQLAGLFFRLVKDDFLHAVQQRRHDRQPLCGIIADELPLLVAESDAEALAIIRSRRAFFIAASQGLAALDERVGVRMRKAMVANFGSVLFLRGREEETDLLAAVSLGMRERTKSVRTLVEEGSVLSISSEKAKENVLVCPPGELGRLAPHEGFAAAPNRERCDLRLMFVPWFEERKQKRTRPQLEDPFSVEHLKRLLRAQGWREELDQPLFEAALRICREPDREQRVEYAKGFFRTYAAMIPRGLETLPSPWLKALPGILWTTRAPRRMHLPYMICELAQSEGLLLVRFAQEGVCELNHSRQTAWDRIRIVLNTSLYPLRWRLLRPRHARQIQARWPEIKPASDSEIV